jgi:hypothetical protein
MDELLKNETYTLKLGEKEYEVSPVNLNILAAIEQEFGCGIGELQNKFNEKQASTLRSLAYVMLKSKNPELTKELIGDNIGIGNIQEVAEKLFSVIKDSMGG